MAEGFVKRPKSAGSFVSQGAILFYCLEYIEQSSESAQSVEKSDIADAHILVPRCNFAGIE